MEGTKPPASSGVGTLLPELVASFLQQHLKNGLIVIAPDTFSKLGNFSVFLSILTKGLLCMRYA